MGFYAKKTMVGYREIDGGASDPDAEYYIETAEEHNESLQRLRKAQEAALHARETAQKAEKEQKQTAENARKQIRQHSQAREDAEKRTQDAEKDVVERDKRISALEGKIEELEKRLQSEKYLHRNMQRIMRERANQARGITPKKAHDGYIVLESRQWEERYTEERWDTEDHRERYGNPENRGRAIRKGYLKIEHKTAEAWRSIIQTPYDASLPIGQVKSRIEEEIGEVLKDINVETRLKTAYNGTYYDFGTNDEGYKKNGMYRWVYKANYRAGLWELEIFTTKSLRVPESRRPPQQKRENGKPNAKKLKDAKKIAFAEEDKKLAAEELELIMNAAW